MALFILKPILWNTNGYRKPAGVKTDPKSFPGMWGFGHEEWNNSPRLAFKERGFSYRVFHTEQPKKAPLAENAGQTFIFMTATHDGVQQLVGVAGNAKFQLDRQERLRIADRLDIDSLAADAWELDKVQALGSDGFEEIWNTNRHWIPNWVCPAEYYLWFDKPVTLDAMQLTGKEALAKMFSSHMTVERKFAAMVMNMVPDAQRCEAWVRLMDAMESAPTEFIAIPDIDDEPRATTRMAMDQARIGQGAYSERVMQKWGRACAVTGLKCKGLLRASHVKPWKSSNSFERLDADNGLMLAAHLDALFDRGFISFDGQGQMLISERLPLDEREHFALPQPLRTRPNAKLRHYLEYHRSSVFLSVSLTKGRRTKSR